MSKRAICLKNRFLDSENIKLFVRTFCGRRVNHCEMVRRPPSSNCKFFNLWRSALSVAICSSGRERGENVTAPEREVRTCLPEPAHRPATGPVALRRPALWRSADSGVSAAARSALDKGKHARGSSVWQGRAVPGLMLHWQSVTLLPRGGTYQ